MQRFVVGLRILPWLILSSCGGSGSSGEEGDPGESWSGDKGNPPSELTVLVGTEKIETGTIAFDFKNVPIYSIFWDERLGSEIFNSVGTGGGVIVSVDGDERAGPPLAQPELLGEGAEAFRVSVDASLPTSFAFRVECVPPRAGVFTATLSSGLLSSEGRHHLRMRCEAVDDYAMVPGEMVFVDPYEDFLITGPNFNSTRHWSATSGELTDADPFYANLRQKGLSRATPFVHAGSSLVLGTDLVDLKEKTSESILTTEELELLQPIVGQLFANFDGTAFAFATNDKKLARKKTGQPLESFEPAAVADPRIGAYKVFHISNDGESIYYYFDTGFGVVFDQVSWRLDCKTGESERWSLQDPSGAPLSDAPTSAKTILFTEDESQVIVLHSLQGQIGVFVYDTEAHSVRPIFEGVFEHLSTLPGRTGSIALVTELRLSPDDRYLSLGVNYFSGVDYWGGPKAAYVYDLVEDAMYSIGVLADGSPISGDGWGYEDTAVSMDGTTAYASVMWSGGVSREVIPSFTLAVPRSQWVRVP